MRFLFLLFFHIFFFKFSFAQTPPVTSPPVVKTPPNVQDEYDTVEINTTLNVKAPGVLSNDTDPDGDKLKVTNFFINGLTYPAGKTAKISQADVTINTNGSYKIVPTRGYTGEIPDIMYEVSDTTYTEYASLRLTVEEITNLVKVTDLESCNQGYTKDGEYKIQYSFTVLNRSTARDYHENNLIRNLDIVNDLSAIYGSGCARVDDISVTTSFPEDYVGKPYPAQFETATVSSEFKKGTSASMFNKNAIKKFILHPRQSIRISYCVTVNAFCGGRPNPTPVSAGVDFNNVIRASSSLGNDTINLLLTNFHSSEAVIASNLYIPITTPEINSDGTFDYTNQITLTNEGAKTANNVNFNLGLGSFLDSGVIFKKLKISQISGPPVTINTAYNGNTNTKLLATGNSLGAGETVVLSIFSLTKPIAGTTDNYFYGNSRTQTQGGADGFNETSASANRTYSFVQWSDASGDHLDRFYVADSSSSIPSSTLQCSCGNISMSFSYTLNAENSNIITQENQIPDGILEHHKATFQITATNTSLAIQLEKLQITDNLNSICGGNVISVTKPKIITSNATITPTLNANFDGVSDINIFDGVSGILKKNQSITIEFTALLKEDCIGNNDSEFTAVDPLGTLINVSSSVSVNAFTDTDNDGISNQNDIDDDNDTIPDVLEYNGQDPLDDADNDNIPNYRDTDFGVDANNDGIVDSFDFDNDGVPNHFDLDSDNDGVPDIIEAGNASVNSNGRTNNFVGSNGLDDTLEMSDTTGTSINYTVLNTDASGNPNFIDIDADGDGIVDNIESQPTDNYTPPTGTVATNGIDTAYTNGILPVDTDKDATPDYVDTNSDNDIKDDIIEGWDTDNDGVAEVNPVNIDTDNDGLDDAYDTKDNQLNPTNGQTPTDFPDVDNTDNPERDWREINAVVVLINNVSVNESETLTFTLTLVKKNDNSVITKSAFPIEINFSTSNGTNTTSQYQVATAPYDFNALEKVPFTITPFTETAQFSVTSLEDTIYELDELFTLQGNITSNNTVNTEIKGTGTIINNDQPPTISMENARVNEGEDLRYTVTISHPSSTPILINVNTSNATAINVEDYKNISETLTIDGTVNPNDANTKVSFAVTTLIDNTNELDEETINVVGNVTSPNVSTQDLTKIGTIVDIDPEPSVIIDNVTAFEGEGLNFTIQIINATTNEPMSNFLPVKFTIQTINGSATAPTDFVNLKQSLTIPIKKQSITKIIETVNDNKAEYPEKMELSVFNISNGASNVIGTGTIKDDDVPNLFSPNGDGKSDVFNIPILVEFPNFKIEIFDRWGSKIYSYSNNGSTSPEWWDGTYKGKPVPEGVYFYTLNYNDGKKAPRTNFIELIR